MKRYQLYLGLILLAVAATGFFFAERLIDGPFPNLSKAKRFFDEYETALTAFVQRLESDHNVGRFVCYPDSVWIEGSEENPRIELTEEQQAEYLALCHAAKAAITWRVDGGYLVHAGSYRRQGRIFEVAFISREPGTGRRPLCSSVADLRDFGACIVPLRGDWVIDYEWRPSDYMSPREKELMELAVDVAETLSDDATEP